MNSWIKLAAVSLSGIVISFGVLWGIQQVNGTSYNNGYNTQQQYQNGSSMNAQGSMNMQGGSSMSSQGSTNMQQGASMGMDQMSMPMMDDKMQDDKMMPMPMM